MRTAFLLLWILTSLVGCGSVAPVASPRDLFHDELFGPPATEVDPSRAMAVSEPMRRYLAEKIAGAGRSSDRRRRLIDSLYDKSELRLEYDSSQTRTAAEAFDARSGNCLSLVMMTAAFAKEMGLAVGYQAVTGAEVWDRSDDVYISIGHVNLTLDERPPQTTVNYQYSEPLVVDFMPSLNAQRLRFTAVTEKSIVAMYSNNRAVETLIDTHVDTAYWWARAAILADPQLMSSYITLAVIYRSAKHPELAERVLSRVLDRDKENTKAMSNQVLVLRDLGRFAEAEALDGQLKRLDPHPAFSYFQLGVAAFREGRLEAARDLFAKEVARAPEQHSFHFWLALTYLELKDTERATAELVQAGKLSTTRRDHDRYAMKLERLKALTQQ